MLGVGFVVHVVVHLVVHVNINFVFARFWLVLLFMSSCQK